MDNIGTDIKSSWTFNDQGDLILVSDEENMVQSIRNRLTQFLNGLDLYYLEYGSILLSFLGWKKNEETLKFMKIEIDNTLRQDPRIPDYDLTLDYNDDGGVDMHLNFNDDGVEYGMSLVITEDGSISIVDDDVSDSEE